MKRIFLTAALALPLLSVFAAAPATVDRDSPEAVLRAYLQALMDCRVAEAADYLHVPQPQEIQPPPPGFVGGLPPPHRLFAFHNAVMIYHAPFASEAAYKAKMRELQCHPGNLSKAFKFYPEKTVLSAPNIAPDGQTVKILATVAYWDAIDNRDEEHTYGYTLTRTDEGWKLLPHVTW